MVATEVKEGGDEERMGHMKYIEDALKHFGINDQEANNCTYLTSCTNSAFLKKESGIDFHLKSIERNDGKEIRKARIIIDYDADFPVIVNRIIAQ